MIDIMPIVGAVISLFIDGMNLTDTWKFQVAGMTFSVLDVALMFIVLYSLLDFVFNLISENGDAGDDEDDDGGLWWFAGDADDHISGYWRP